MIAGYGEQAITNDELFSTIVTHRKSVNPIRGMDYSNHEKGKLKILPPEEIRLKWQSDYKTMRQNMISGESLKWEELLEQIKVIENKLNKQTREKKFSYY